MLQEPAVGDLVLPAHIPGVLPQQPDLVAGVPCVPQGVSEMFPWASFRLHSLDKDMGKMLDQGTRRSFLLQVSKVNVEVNSCLLQGYVVFCWQKHKLSVLFLLSWPQPHGI